VLLEHAPIGFRFGSAVTLLEGVKWQGPSVQATATTGARQRRAPQMQFKKIKRMVASSDKNVATG